MPIATASPFSQLQALASAYADASKDAYVDGFALWRGMNFEVEG